MRIALATASILLAALQAPAQLSTSIIRGHVSDPAGAALLGAQIKLVNTQTAVERDVVTNSDGDFEIPRPSARHLPSHHYPSRLQSLYRREHRA
jgi:Carboxypeptidase regulatory-like domain